VSPHPGTDSPAQTEAWSAIGGWREPGRTPFSLGCCRNAPRSDQPVSSLVVAESEHGRVMGPVRLTESRPSVSPTSSLLGSSFKGRASTAGCRAQPVALGGDRGPHGSRKLPWGERIWGSPLRCAPGGGCPEGHPAPRGLRPCSPPRLHHFNAG
jgi:hypothetical protein